jgi:two-component system, OmpR family, response regulator
MARPRRILVVDDDATLRETLLEVLTEDGFDVRSAADGAKAIEQLRSWRADLVILDLMMPGMDANAFRMAQRAARRDPAPILILSAAPGLHQAGKQIEAADVVAKPFRLNDLLAAVERALGGRGGGPAREPGKSTYRSAGPSLKRQSPYHFSR